MARLVRLCPPGIPQHIIQRGNNRQICFAAEADFAAYAHWLHESAEKYGVAIHAWIFMTVRWQFPDDAESGASLCGLGKPARLWKPHPIYLQLGDTEPARLLNYRSLFTGHIDEDLLGDIRGATNKGLALGNERFKDQVAEITGRRLTPGKRGPRRGWFLLWPQIRKFADPKFAIVGPG